MKLNNTRRTFNMYNFTSLLFVHPKLGKRVTGPAFSSTKLSYTSPISPLPPTDRTHNDKRTLMQTHSEKGNVMTMRMMLKNQRTPAQQLEQQPSSSRDWSKSSTSIRVLAAQITQQSVNTHVHFVSRKQCYDSNDTAYA